MTNALLQVAPVPSISKAMQSGYNIKGMQTRNALLSQQLKDYPEERAWTKEKREIERDEYEYTKHLRKFKTSLEPLVKLKALDEMLRLVSNKTTLSNHDAVTENVYRQLGIDENMAQNRVTAAQITQQAQAAGQDPETYYQQVYKPQSLMKWDQQFELMMEQIKAGKPTYEHLTIYGPKGETKRASVKKGEEYTPPEGWSLNKPSETKLNYDHVTVHLPEGGTRRHPVLKGKPFDPEKIYGKGATLRAPSRGEEFEERLSKRQELISIRQDKRALKREISNIRSKPAIDPYQGEKARLPLLEDELSDLEDREKELLGKTTTQPGKESLRDKAIMILEKNGKVVNEETIIKVMGRIEEEGQ